MADPHNDWDNDCDEPDPGPVARAVIASAPTRTADVGGWSDTWFARRGVVCNVAIDHRAVVRVDVDPASPPQIQLDLQMTGEHYGFCAATPPGRHPMLEAAASTLAPTTCGVVVQVGRTIEGSGLGTSAAVVVAMVAALRTACGRHVEPGAVAAEAHGFETRSGRQAGVQDHVAAAYGGISLISVDYPRAHRCAVNPPTAIVAELGRRLITVFFGRSHQSSAMHDEVIARLTERHSSTVLDRIRHAAEGAARALASGDIDAYAAALTLNHDALDDLHPDLVSAEANELIELARGHGAAGWKTNGAGGQGGSMALIGPADADACDALRAAIAARAPWRCVDAAIATDGVVVQTVRFGETT